METVDVELSDFTLRARSMLVSHVASGLTRGLEPGEQVIVRDATRGRFSAYVADIGFEPADTVYRLRIGVRLTEEEAAERLRGASAPAAGGTLTRQGVLDLLGELRAAGRTVPAPARRRGRRADTAL
jgi:hypothetical protein